MENSIEKTHTIKLASDSNYAVWKFALKIILCNSVLIEVLDGSPQKSTEAKGDAKRKAWLKKDIEAQKFIVSSVGEQSMVHLMVCDTAAEMWKRLETVYGRISEASVNTRMQKFYGSKYESDSMVKHIAKLKDLAHQLNIL